MVSKAALKLRRMRMVSKAIICNWWQINIISFIAIWQLNCFCTTLQPYKFKFDIKLVEDLHVLRSKLKSRGSYDL